MLIAHRSSGGHGWSASDKISGGGWGRVAGEWWLAPGGGEDRITTPSTTATTSSS